MFCHNCGKQLNPDEAVCSACGTPTPASPPPSKRFCPNCGAETDAAAGFCVRCGMAMTPAAAPPPGAVAYDPTIKSKLVAGILGILLGGLGIHRFYLGYNSIGIIQIVVTVVLGILTCGIGVIVGHIWGLIEGILILTGSINKDAQGRPLRE
jgi:TM2 domain-containing membrane protein YozV